MCLIWVAKVLRYVDRRFNGRWWSKHSSDRHRHHCRHRRVTQLWTRSIRAHGMDRLVHCWNQKKVMHTVESIRTSRARSYRFSNICLSTHAGYCLLTDFFASVLHCLRPMSERVYGFSHFFQLWVRAALHDFVRKFDSDISFCCMPLLFIVLFSILLWRRVCLPRIWCYVTQ